VVDYDIVWEIAKELPQLREKVKGILRS